MSLLDILSTDMEKKMKRKLVIFTRRTTLFRLVKNAEIV